jgi:hypothetical protein
MSLFSFHPANVFLLSFVGLWLAALAGAWLRLQVGFDKARREDLGLILAATLTLLGLLIGFSFSMAASRYDQRKNLEEAEANAIGTEYLRADLLPAADGARLRELLKKYAVLRIQFYEAGDEEVAAIDRQTAKLQADLWSAVVAPAAQQPNPVVALAVAGLNDVVNSQGYTQAAWWNHIPVSAGLLMTVIALLCNLLIGYSSLSVTPRSILLAILPLFTAMAFMLINDIDSPRRGLIHVVPKNLASLLESLKP